MEIIDISRTLKAGTAIWPGDTPYRLAETQNISHGDSVNLTTLTLSAHTGSHVDAPYHFTIDGLSIDRLELIPYWGLCQVVSVKKREGPLQPADFLDVDVSQAPRLLVRSEASSWDESLFPERFVYPSPDLADYLGREGIILYGTDGPSMDVQDSKTLAGHHALFRNGIALLEWLRLGHVSDGLYELVALPLKIAGGDGSPVRAALRPLSPRAS